MNKIIIIYKEDIILKNNKGIFETLKKGSEEEKILKIQEKVRITKEQKNWLINERQWHRFNLKKALLINTEEFVTQFLLKFWKIERKPVLLIIEGPDGSGKSYLCDQLEKLLEKPIKRKTNITKWSQVKFLEHDQYRIRRVKELSERLITFDIKDNFIMAEKSPYADYYYRKNPAFKEHFNMNHYAWHKIKEQMYMEYYVIENAIKIYVENIDAERNYYGRNEQGNYKKMAPTAYRKMIIDFEQGIMKLYQNKEKLFKIRMENNNERNTFEVYNKIMEIIDKKSIKIPDEFIIKNSLPKIITFEK